MTTEITAPITIVTTTVDSDIRLRDGRKGDTGSQGVSGIQGIQGDTGSQGVSGIQGIQGDTGSQGVSGIQGDSGVGVPTGGDIDQVLTKATSGDYDTTWTTPITATGSAYTWKEKLNGEIFTDYDAYFVVPDELDGKDIKEVRISLLGLPSGQAVKIDIRKNGLTTADSIFTSDVPIEIGTAQATTNGVYQTGCNVSGSTVGAAGTTLDSARDTLAADDVLYIRIIQTGSILTGADLSVGVSIA